MLYFFIAECNKGCLSNQECSAPDTCTCLAGWIGEKCQRGNGIITPHPI